MSHRLDTVACEPVARRYEVAIVLAMVATRVVTMTAKDLKSRTGEALRVVASGRRVVVTRRGKTLGVIVPAGDAVVTTGAKPLSYDAAWAEIETALGASPARHRTWQHAMAQSRRRR